MPPSTPDVDIRRLEEVAALGWPAPDTARLGDWLLRAAEGWTGRANSVLPLGEPGRPFADALSAVRQWYAERGLPARLQVPLPLCEALDAALAGDGWRAYNPTLVRVGTVDRVLAKAGDGGSLPPVTLETTPTDAWLAAYHYRGGDAVPPVATRVMTAAADPVFASVVIDGTVTGVARAVVDHDADGVGWCGITAVETAPEWRRRGIGRHLVGGVVRWAAGRGASLIYLQVMETNGPAHAMYDRLGFITSHRYHYRTPT
jgi:GNAT superfamily N-acetyltransferase